jgi:hypothetical protein
VKRRAALAAYLALPAACGELPPPAPRSTIEVLASRPESPSMMLGRQIAKGCDAFVLVDVGCFANSIARSIRQHWQAIEWRRWQCLDHLLRDMQERFADSDAADPRSCTAVAKVGLCLLWNQREVPDAPRSMLDELREVYVASAGVLHFVPGQPPVDWAGSVPRWPYAREGAGESRPGSQPGLYRATVYLRCCIEHFTPGQHAVWNVAFTASGASEPGLDPVRCDAALQLLLGPLPSTPTGLPDMVALCERFAAPPLDVGSNTWDGLDRMLGRIQVPEPRTVRDAFLDLAHVLAGETADDAMLQGLAPEQWRRKWADAAACAYLGLCERESRPAGPEAVSDEPLPTPHVLIEPVPRSWQALRRLAGMLESTPRAAERHGQMQVAAIDDVLAALDLQSRGEPLGRELEHRLLAMMLGQFAAVDVAVPVPVAGVPGAVRRAEPCLVRLPVRVAGRTVQALGFRWFVEHETGPRTWTPPPWGVELRADAIK